MLWDDEVLILKNKYIQDWQYIGNYFSEGWRAGAGEFSQYFWRPLPLLIFSLQWHLWQDWVIPYHALNIALHIFNAVLLYFLLSRLLPAIKNQRFIAAAIASIFLVHPIQTEVVTFISGLPYPLAFAFMLLGAFLYLEKDRRLHYWLSLGMFALALLSKEGAIIFPILLALIEFFFLNPAAVGVQKIKQIIKNLWPFFILIIIYLWLRSLVIDYENGLYLYNSDLPIDLGFAERLTLWLRALPIYFGLLFAPINLHLERGVELLLTPATWPAILIGAALLTGLILLAIVNLKRWPIISFGIFWFFIGLTPVSGLLAYPNSPIREHWLYLPMIGIALAATWAAAQFLEKCRPTIQKTAVAVFIGFIIIFSLLTISRNRDWQDAVTLFTNTLRHAPRSYMATGNLGGAYARQGNFVKAEKYYQKAIVLKPNLPFTYYNLGKLYQHTGKRQAAMEYFRQSTEKDGSFIIGYTALANFYIAQGRLAEARQILEQYLPHANKKSKIAMLNLLIDFASQEKDIRSVQTYQTMLNTH